MDKSQMKNVLCCLLGVGLIFSCVSCSPTVGSELEVTYLPGFTLDAGDKSGLFPLEGLPIQVGAFTDDRGLIEPIEINNHKVTIVGTLPLLVQDSFNEVLKSVNTTPCSDQCIKITGHIKEWNMTVTNHFPTSTVKATVQLEVEFTSSSGYQSVLLPKVLIGKASGSSQKEHPFLDEQKLIEVYGDALHQATVGALVQLGKHL